MPAALAIGAVIIALVALLVLYGGSYLAKAVAQLVPNVPIIGSAIKSVILAASSALESWALATWDHVLRPVADLILAPIVAIKGIISDTALAIAETIDTANWVIDTYVPAGIRAVESYAAGKVTTLANRVTDDVISLNRKITIAVSTAEDYTDTWIKREAQRITDDVASLNNKITAAIGTAEAYAAVHITDLARVLATDVATLDGHIAASLSTAETYALAQVTGLADAVRTDVAELDNKITAAEQTAISSAVGIITTDIDQAIEATRDAVTGAVDGAINIAADGFTDIVAGLRDIDWAQIGDIAGVVAGTGAIATVLGRYLEDCGIPNCRNLGGLGRFLENLLSDASLAALLAMLVMMIKDPEGAAQITMSDLGGLAQDALNTAVSLVGV